jgi:hypothetical protein
VTPPPWRRQPVVRVLIAGEGGALGEFRCVQVPVKLVHKNQGTQGRNHLLLSEVSLARSMDMRPRIKSFAAILSVGLLAAVPLGGVYAKGQGGHGAHDGGSAKGNASSGTGKAGANTGNSKSARDRSVGTNATTGFSGVSISTARSATSLNQSLNDVSSTPAGAFSGGTPAGAFSGGTPAGAFSGGTPAGAFSGGTPAGATGINGTSIGVTSSDTSGAIR